MNSRSGHQSGPQEVDGAGDALPPVEARKLQRPDPPGVPRPRIAALLDAGRARPLTLIRTPAGWGRTSAVADWIASRPGLDAAWLSLDEDDTRSRFRAHVLAGLEPIAPDLVARLRTEFGGRAGTGRSFAVELVNGLNELRRPAVIVLDDVDAVPAGLASAAIQFLVEHCRGPVHLVATCRTRPGLALHRLRAAAAVTELGPADLAFDEEEARALCDLAGIERLSDSRLQALVAATEGWVTGLEVAIRAMQAAPDVASVVERFDGADPDVAAYFDREVVSRLPYDTYRFLLDTSVLSELEPARCAALTGRTDAGEVLSELVDAGVPLLPVDDWSGRLRHHRPFCEFLRRRLAEDSPEAPAAQHRRAALWYREHGHVASAVTHLLDAGDADDAFDLLSNAWRLAGPDRRHQLAWLLDELPASVLQGDLRRMTSWAVMLVDTGRLDAASSWLNDVERTASRTDPSNAVTTALAVARVRLAVREGAAEAVVHHARAALRRLPPDGPTAGVVRAALVEAHVLRSDLAAAAFVDREARRLSAPDSPARAALDGVQAVLAAWEGRLREAEELAADVLLEPEQARWELTPTLLNARIARGAVRRERSDLERAVRELEQAVADADAGGWISASALARMELVMAQLALGRPGTALGVVQAARNGPRPLSHHLARRIALVEIRVLLAVGDVAGAGAIIDALTPSRLVSAYAARWALADGDPELALRYAADPMPALRRRVEALVLTAQARHALGDHTGAEAAIVDAVNAARREGFVRVFLDDGPVVVSLLSTFVRRTGDRYARRLVQIAEARGGGVQQSTAGERGVASLSAREQQVLRYLAGRLSNQEIARELSVSLNTVKTHLRSIYRKLDASSRHDAVARMRSLF